ncbi:PREDICTED: uncharacterized protein LOC104698719 [Camelina sativa]|uniref:Uncharacterized protein LOC104698719 n=1 Tax=Camelina sativa TaxID=90675 RepID=A0ABM0SKF5_CAMSA|nr:PREDICTED: uncharacterized protein LOC104698719 [Camelina sativa]
MRIEDPLPIDDSMPEERLMHITFLEEMSHTIGHTIAYSIPESIRSIELMAIESAELPWYSDFVNYMVCGEIPKDYDAHRKKKFFRDVNNYYWDEPYLYKKGANGLFRRCIAEEEVRGVLEHCHRSAYRGQFATFKTVQKILQAGRWWPTMFKDAQL